MFSQTRQKKYRFKKGCNLVTDSSKVLNSISYWEWGVARCWALKDCNTYILLVKYQYLNIVGANIGYWIKNLGNLKIYSP